MRYERGVAVIQTLRKGGGGGGLQKVFSALQASVWSNNKGGQPPLPPPLDPPPNKFLASLDSLSHKIKNKFVFIKQIQSNLSNTDTEGTEQSVRIREVAV